jgi:hypothetical protein
MRRDLVKKLVKAWDRHVAAKLPTFSPSEFKLPCGESRVYVDASAEPAFFISVQIADKRDAFTVEFAWSRDGAFPDLADHPMPRSWPAFGVSRGDADVDRFRFRLTKLWELPKYDPWWEFEPRQGSFGSAKLSVVADQEVDDEAKCEQLVSDAISKILDHGMKYVREVRQRSDHAPGR